MDGSSPRVTESSDHRGPEVAPREGETAPVDVSREVRRAAISVSLGHEVPHARNRPRLRLAENRQFHADVISGFSGGSVHTYELTKEHVRDIRPAQVRGSGREM
ncbi:hypothetical protein GN958_ATG00791 [Phytophthora infestans]|nr:hypothetical protein GN958_ATG00791 [Phytophthora infestans]